MSRHVSVRIALLDKQILDADDRPIGRVDDVEIADAARGAAPRVTALLTGAEALGPVLGGITGAWMANAAARLRGPGDPEGPTRVDVDAIAELEPMVRLRLPLRELGHVAGLERWLAHNLVDRLPGAGDAHD